MESQMNLRSGRMAQVRRKEEARMLKDIVYLKHKKIKSKSRGRIKDKSKIGWMFE